MDRTVPKAPNRDAAHEDNKRKAIVAKARTDRAYYDAYLEQGFTPAQAFELTKQRVTM